MRIPPKDNFKLSIIKTLAYGDVFDFPMRGHEVWKYYIGSKKVTGEEVDSVLNSMATAGLIGKKKKYFFLIGREHLVEIRKEREKESIEKIKIAYRVAKTLKLIPTVRLIGISGSLSMKNAKKTDDIDLLVITDKGALWITRFLINTILIGRGYKRSTNDPIGRNLVCPNMFLAEDSIAIPKQKQNIFSAHEIAQLKVLVNKGHTYEFFTNSNAWVKRFLPNFAGGNNIKIAPKTRSLFLSAINRVFYILQLLYMKRRVTREEVGISMARFHPKDKTEVVKTLFSLRYKRYIILLKDAAKDRTTKGSLPHPVTRGY